MYPSGWRIWREPAAQQMLFHIRPDVFQRGEECRLRGADRDLGDRPVGVVGPARQADPPLLQLCRQLRVEIAPDFRGGVRRFEPDFHGAHRCALPGLMIETGCLGSNRRGRNRNGRAEPGQGLRFRLGARPPFRAVVACQKCEEMRRIVRLRAAVADLAQNAGPGQPPQPGGLSLRQQRGQHLDIARRFHPVFADDPAVEGQILRPAEHDIRHQSRENAHLGQGPGNEMRPEGHDQAAVLSGQPVQQAGMGRVDPVTRIVDDGARQARQPFGGIREKHGAQADRLFPDRVQQHLPGADRQLRRGDQIVRIQVAGEGRGAEAAHALTVGDATRDPGRRGIGGGDGGRHLGALPPVIVAGGEIYPRDAELAEEPVSVARIVGLVHPMAGKAEHRDPARARFEIYDDIRAGIDRFHRLLLRARRRCLARYSLSSAP